MDTLELYQFLLFRFIITLQKKSIEQDHKTLVTNHVS